MSQLDELLAKLKKRADYLEQLNSQTIDAGDLMTKRSYLHQTPSGNGEMSEGESAIFEQQNPEIIKFLQNLKESLFNALE